MRERVRVYGPYAKTKSSPRRFLERDDLVVLKDDPVNDIRALAAVQYTLRAGKIIYRLTD